MRYSRLLTAALLGVMASLQGCNEASTPTADETLLGPGGEVASGDPSAPGGAAAAGTDAAMGGGAASGADIGLAANKTLDPALCALNRGSFTLESENDFFPISVGDRWVYEGREDGVPLRLRITVLNETENVGGVRTRVIEEIEWEDGELLERSRNFYAVARDETVCYFGEEVDIYENGKIVSHAGAWRADAPGNAPGIFMPGEPRVGMKYKQENAPGIAEDTAEIVTAGRVRVPAGTFREGDPYQGHQPPGWQRGLQMVRGRRRPGHRRTQQAGEIPRDGRRRRLALNLGVRLPLTGAACGTLAGGIFLDNLHGVIEPPALLGTDCPSRRGRTTVPVATLCGRWICGSGPVARSLQPVF